MRVWSTHANIYKHAWRIEGGRFAREGVRQGRRWKMHSWGVSTDKRRSFNLQSWIQFLHVYAVKVNSYMCIYIYRFIHLYIRDCVWWNSRWIDWSCIFFFFFRLSFYNSKIKYIFKFHIDVEWKMNSVDLHGQSHVSHCSKLISFFFLSKNKIKRRKKINIYKSIKW